MLSSMIGPLTFAILLAVGLMLAALVAEGRGRHIARFVVAVRSRRDLQNFLAEAPYERGDWDLVAHVDSTPDRPAPGTRVAIWATDTGTRASRAVADRASALGGTGDAIETGPGTGELGLARQ
ncbi:hypothetical protein ACNI3K_07660 [Demequina sp. SO4-13]|uniref:hypothetical protein n=1 Tax=Demequina sp. SO4-13 TaxID=3401027 RepID=UPI003AF5AE09